MTGRNSRKVRIELSLARKPPSSHPQGGGAALNVL